MIVGTAGHIDHGKTALVKALTGVDADRLAEEKARGITIDLGFAYARLGAEAGLTGFVDVPGHERLIHTMLAGAGGIDFALLIVAADDGVMPQTREHLAILDLLGLGRGAVALSKADLADDARRAAVTAEIDALLAGTSLAGAPVFSVSAVTGAGIAALRAHLAAEERATVARGATGPARLAIDRAFTLKGAGTIVTGTLISGTIGAGDRVAISPSGLSARVRGVHAQNTAVKRGVAGQRCALNLGGEAIAKEAIHRGDLVVTPGLLAPTDRIDAHFRLLPTEARPIAAPLPVRLHTGALEVGARLVPLGGPLAPGAAGFVQLVVERPIAAFAGDRFILRDAAASRTPGGGGLVDLRPPARGRARPERRAFLSAAANRDPAAALSAMLAVSPGMVDPLTFGRDRGLSEAELVTAIARAGAEPLGAMLIAAGGRARLGEAIRAALEAFHAANPALQGIPRERLRLTVARALPPADFLAHLRRAAEAGAVVVEGAFLRLPSHAPRLTAEDEALYARVAEGLGGAARFRPPRVRDFAAALAQDEAELRRVLRLCARAGRLDEIAKDHFFLRRTTAEMAGFVRALSAAAPDGWFAAGAFRDEMDNGRKVAIQVLDFFDRQGLTLRRGDLRRLNPPRAELFAPEETA